GNVDRGRPLVVEEVGMHLLDDPVLVGLAESDPDPAADDHRLDVEQVDRGGDPRSERLDRLIDQLDRQLVLLVQRPLPDPARESIAPVPLGDLEEVGLAALLVLPTRTLLHRRAPGVGLEATAAPARTMAATHLHHHVADLAGAAAPEPVLAVEDDPAAD